MRLLVLGATGGTGLEIVKQAIERSHSVTAFVRSPEKLKQFGSRITVVQGNLLNTGDMQTAAQGQEAIVSGFGPRQPVPKGEENLLERFAVTLTCALTPGAVRRVVIESTAFLFKDSILPPSNLFGRLFFAGVVKDATAMEEIIAASALDWTLVRPPRLTDKARTGKYRVLEGHLPRFGFSISRADVADYMIKAAENHSSIRKVVGVSN
jgi:putative NADH-flavin reductase